MKLLAVKVSRLAQTQQNLEYMTHCNRTCVFVGVFHEERALRMTSLGMPATIFATCKTPAEGGTRIGAGRLSSILFSESLYSLGLRSLQRYLMLVSGTGLPSWCQWKFSLRHLLTLKRLPR
eukprot:5658797-Amphidinium_carterae.1